VKKVMFATLLGGFLGVFDGLTALFTPEVRDQIVGIVIGSTVKGLLAGVIIGFFATRVRSLVIGTIFGLAVGAFFAYLILLMNPGHALNIMLPGSLVGVIVGYTAQKQPT
jgi:branched-subunit amino acid transport protein